MAWQDRVREAAYTSPNGTRLVFQYENVSRETSKRTATFDFPGVDDGYVQDNGFGARRYPLRCFFSGADHDIEADAFEAALLERGRGRLEHPLYGTIDVVPVGDISRRDDLQDAANQTILEVTFSTSIGALYPAGATSLRSEVVDALEAFEETEAQQFADDVDLSTVAAQESLKAAVRDFLNGIRSALGAVAAVDDEISTAFNDARRAIDEGLDLLIADPVQLGREIANLITSPASAGAAIGIRLEAFASLIESTLVSPRAKPADAFENGVVLASRRRTVANDFHTSCLVATSALAGLIRSTMETQFTARPEAIAAAESILAELDLVVTWMDEGFETLSDVDAPGSIDTGEGYQAIQHAAAIAAGDLVEISFTLLPERRIVLTRARTIIDLAAELYGSVDDNLDFLIETNMLTGSEILELPAGKTIVFYA